MVKTAQGRADTKLSSQMRRMIFLAFPMVEDLARGESGLQIARYLKLSVSPPSQSTVTKPQTNLSKLNATMVRMEA